jgi:hypothetical protein
LNAREITEFLENLPTRLGHLSPRESVAFGASIAERSHRNYVRFTNEERWGDPEPLREALDFCWAFVKGEPRTEDFRSLLAKCEAARPDTEKFSSVLATSAEEAVLTVLLLLEAVATQDHGPVVRVANFARDTIDMAVQFLLDLSGAENDLEERILSHPLMSLEFEKQKADIEYLESGVGMDPLFIERLRERAVVNPSGTITLT